MEWNLIINLILKITIIKFKISINLKLTRSWKAIIKIRNIIRRQILNWIIKQNFRTWKNSFLVEKTSN